MTKSERNVEASLRAERKTRNEALPHIENGLRYDIDETTHTKFYWGVRNGRLIKVKIEPRNPQPPQTSNEQHTTGIAQSQETQSS